MKKHYDITLEEEKVEALKVWLKKNGLTFSGYLEILIGENLEALERFAPKSKNARFTLFTLLGLAGQMTKELKKEIKK